ncbi:heme ABC exporter ATP-binding protein CcmA [Chelativorans sp. M5D2P16]|uniref:heme ABC exporter ATP-binding protein CcmA n=1 Tax=Chelativorans sp. M5D2P16 TaxID=3095678 RepID=UPI002ACABC5B|nr:heme ABC exporter ATP-binding protein CcmA [Chelativorans sp. M5D2P16]MDZ5699395.1 heme ABC exporter ATP-binding protein CcmA [Chelativorans sp. M5D2P16]
MRLAAEDLSGERGGERIFSGMSFTVEGGRALVVTGPNGIGKSTLLRVLAGLLRPVEGHVTLTGGGAEWPDLPAAAHYLGHLNAMKNTLTVEENLVFWRRFLGAGEMGVEAALETVGLSEIGHLPFGYLSTGQRRRAAIARLLATHRPVWLLDEPTAGLDRASEARFSELMQAHLQGGGMIVAATHLPLGLEGAAELRMGARE